MKKYISLIMVFVMLFAFSACAGKESVEQLTESQVQEEITQTEKTESTVKAACKAYGEFIAPMADGNITNAAVIDLDKNGVPEVIFAYYGAHNLYILSYGETEGLNVIEPEIYSSTPAEVYISTSEPILYYADHGHTQGTASYHKAECFRAGAEGFELIGTAEGDEWADVTEEVWQDSELFAEYDKKYDKIFDDKVKEIVGDGEFVSFFDICENENAQEYIEEKLAIDFDDFGEALPSEEESDDLSQVMEAYRGVLEDIYENPADYYETDSEFADGNTFAIGDINGDGIPELCVRFENTYTAAMKAAVWSYDSEEGAYKAFEHGVVDEFYATGYMKSDAYHNHTAGETIWPYTIDELDFEGGRIEDLYSFWSIEEENAFPDRPYVAADDADGDGVIYYMMDLTQEDFAQQALTENEYLDFIADYIPENEKIQLEYSELNAENIEAVGL